MVERPAKEALRKDAERAGARPERQRRQETAKRWFEGRKVVEIAAFSTS